MRGECVLHPTLIIDLGFPWVQFSGNLLTPNVFGSLLSRTSFSSCSVLKEDLVTTFISLHKIRKVETFCSLIRGFRFGSMVISSWMNPPADSLESLCHGTWIESSSRVSSLSSASSVSCITLLRLWSSSAVMPVNPVFHFDVCERVEHPSLNIGWVDHFNVIQRSHTKPCKGDEHSMCPTLWMDHSR